MPPTRDSLEPRGSHQSWPEVRRRDALEGHAHALIGRAAALLSEASPLRANSGHNDYPQACNAQNVGVLAEQVAALTPQTATAHRATRLHKYNIPGDMVRGRPLASTDFEEPLPELPSGARAQARRQV